MTGTVLSPLVTLDVDGLLELCRREADYIKQELKLDIVIREGDSVLFTDGVAAVLVSPAQAKLYTALRKAGVQPPEKGVAALLKKFDIRNPRFRVSSFTTTVAGLWDWCNKDIDACPCCGGNKKWAECMPLKRGEEVLPEEASREEDAFDIHYGWVGTARIDRRRMQKLLSLVKTAPTLKCRLYGVEDSANNMNWVHVVLPGVRWVLMGIWERREAETSFQRDGARTHHTYREGK